MSCADKVSGQQLAILASVIASLISEGMDKDEQNVLGNFFTVVGASLMTIAAQSKALPKTDN